MGFFAWITEGVRRAVVRGIELAANDINEGEEAQITLRLPAHREPLRLDEPAREAQQARNGRRGKVSV